MSLRERLSMMGERLSVMEARQTQQAFRLDALQSQVQVISSLLKETIIIQQLLYTKGTITREEVKDELQKQQQALADRLEETRKQAALQSEDSGTDEDSSGDATGVSSDESDGGDPPRPSRPKLWTPGGYV